MPYQPFLVLDVWCAGLLLLKGNRSANERSWYFINTVKSRWEVGSHCPNEPTSVGPIQSLTPSDRPVFWQISIFKTDVLRKVKSDVCDRVTLNKCVINLQDGGEAEKKKEFSSWCRRGRTQRRYASVLSFMTSFTLTMCVRFKQGLFCMSKPHFNGVLIKVLNDHGF